MEFETKTHRSHGLVVHAVPAEENLPPHELDTNTNNLPQICTAFVSRKDSEVIGNAAF
jgi:hypothetical protein